ncbi:MAG: aminotransferase class V-fold PLP-dependent enzyme [Gammaproteobacteria bacterium]
MQPEQASVQNGTEPTGTIKRRSFLKTLGAAAGLATVMGPDALHGIEAAVRNSAGLTPREAARDEALWSEVQQAFTMSRSLINLDNAWTCPSPRVVTEALVQYIWHQEKVPAQQWVNDFEDRVDTVRVALARLYGVNAGEIAVVRNTTEALKTVLYGVELKAGDEVLTTRLDYSSMISALRHRQQRDGITLTRIDVPVPPQSPDELVEAFARAITRKTRLILTSHIAYLNGQVFPVGRICDLAHQHGIEVVVDGAHSFAHLADTQQDIRADYYGTSLHKWMLAPKGTGMLFIPEDKIEKIQPLMSGPSRRRNASMGKFESVGTQSLAPFLAIGEAIIFHNAIGPKRKEERLRYLTHYWVERLQTIPKIRLYTSLDSEMSCGIATIGIEGIHPVPLGDYLWEQHHIQTAPIERGETIQGLRISPNLYTTLHELDYFCEVMEHVTFTGLPEPYASYKPRSWRFDG